MVFGTAQKLRAFPPELRARYQQAWARPGALTGGLNYYRALDLPGQSMGPSLRLKATMRLPEMPVTVPTLVIWGEKDPALLPGNLDGLEAYVPDLRVERLPAASHWVVHEEPEQVLRLIHRWLL